MDRSCFVKNRSTRFRINRDLSTNARKDRHRLVDQIGTRPSSGSSLVRHASAGKWRAFTWRPCPLRVDAANLLEDRNLPPAPRWQVLATCSDRRRHIRDTSQPFADRDRGARSAHRGGARMKNSDARTTSPSAKTGHYPGNAVMANTLGIDGLSLKGADGQRSSPRLTRSLRRSVRPRHRMGNPETA